MAADKIRVLFVDTGHKYNMEATYGEKLRAISERFTGSVLTFGEEGEFQFGDFTVHSLPLKQPKLAMFFRRLAHGRRLADSARRAGKPFDAVVSYDPLTTGLLGMLIARRQSFPLIVELNGDCTDWSNYADIANPYKRRAKRWMSLKVARLVLQYASGVKMLYGKQLDYFRPKLRGQRTVRVFPNFLDVSAFQNLGESKKLVIVGFPFVVKGIDIAVAAFRQVTAQFPDWMLEILGFYTGREKQLLDACIEGHPQIRHNPPLTRVEMPKYIGVSGIVVCASRTEGFPRVIKEAMHAGKPCIVSDVGGLPDAIRHGVNGLIFKSESTDDLAEQMRLLLADAEMRRSLGAAAQVHAQREYSNANYVRQLAEFVGVVKRPRSGAPQ